MRRPITPSGSRRAPGDGGSAPTIRRARWARRGRAAARRRRLDADDQQVAMAELEQVLRRRARAALVIDLDERQVLERAGVDHDERQPGRTDLLDLRVIRRQPDRDDAVDGGAAHRPGEAATQRGDEVERVALLLGGQRDALAERAEERVA